MRAAACSNEKFAPVADGGQAEVVETGQRSQASTRMPWGQRSCGNSLSPLSFSTGRGKRAHTRRPLLVQPRLDLGWLLFVRDQRQCTREPVPRHYRFKNPQIISPNCQTDANAPITVAIANSFSAMDSRVQRLRGSTSASGNPIANHSMKLSFPWKLKLSLLNWTVKFIADCFSTSQLQ